MPTGNSRRPTTSHRLRTAGSWGPSWLCPVSFHWPGSRVSPCTIAQARRADDTDCSFCRRPSDRQDVDPESGCIGEGIDISWIRGHDLVAGVAQRHERSVDGVRQAGPRQQDTSPAAEVIVERDDQSAEQCLRQLSLPSRSATPDLCHDAAMRQRRATPEVCIVHPSPEGTIVLLQGDEGTSVKHQAHAVPFDMALRRSPSARTCSAAILSRRRCSSISSSVILPNSAS